MAKPPLVLTCPGAQEFHTTVADGDVVDFLGPMIRGGKPPYRVFYSRQAGAVFPVGTTTINILVQDRICQVARCSFPVTLILDTVSGEAAGAAAGGSSAAASGAYTTAAGAGTATGAAAATARGASSARVDARGASAGLSAAAAVGTVTPSSPLSAAGSSAGSGIVLGSSTPSTFPYSTSKALLQQSDFFLKNVYTIPEDTYASVGITSRVVSGNFRVFTSLNYDRLLELAPPSTITLDPPYASATIVRDHGAFHGGYMGATFKPIYTQIGYFLMTGLYHDLTPTTGSKPRMYWTANQQYNSSADPENVFGFSELEVDGITWTPKAMWPFDNSRPAGYGSRFATGMLEFPSDFRTAVLSGRRLGMGWGGDYHFGIQGNNMSIGPALFAIDEPTGLEPHSTIFTGVKQPILWHPYHEAAYNIPRIARRPTSAPSLLKAVSGPHGDDPSASDPWLPHDGVEYDSVSDQYHGLWIDLPTKHGLLVFSSNTEGNAVGTVVSGSQVNSANPKIWDIHLDTVAGFRVNQSVYVPSAYAPGYGGYEGYISSIDAVANILHIYFVSASIGPSPVDGTSPEPWQPYTWAPTVGKPLSAGVWYGGGGWKAPGWGTHWNMYNPVSLAANALNVAGPWSELDPAVSFEQRYNRSKPYPLGSAGDGGCWVIGATLKKTAPYEVHVLVENADRAGDNNHRVMYVFGIT